MGRLELIMNSLEEKDGETSGVEMQLELHKHSFGKVKRVLLIFVFAHCLPAFAADKEELLKNARALVGSIWTNWMQMPKLTYDRITTNKLG